MRIVLLGNYDIYYSSETYYVKTLEAMGHEVIALQEGEVSLGEIREKALDCDLFVWVHGHSRSSEGMGDLLKELKEKKIPTVSYHHDLFFGLGREKDLDTVDVYKHIDHFFTTDKNLANWFNDNTEVKGHYLFSGVYDQEAITAERSLSEIPKVVFVGNKGYHPEWPYRPQLINWLAEIYGDDFGWYSTEEQSLGVKRGLDLNQLYTDAQIVVGDTLCPNFDYPDYWSDRTWETLGRGGFLIHPYIKGMEEVFEDGKHLVFYEYGDFEDLKNKIDFYLQNDTAREYIRRQGHKLVKDNHTYKQRWEEILREIDKNK